MGTLYSGDVYGPKKSTDDLLVATHRVLQRLGLTLDEPPDVSVIDTEADEDVPEYHAVDLQDAIQYMRRWPCTTALEYSLLGLNPDALLGPPAVPRASYPFRVDPLWALK